MTPRRLDKAALVAAWRAVLNEKIDALNSGQQAARSSARVDGDHRPANRGERAAVSAAGYLAHGLGQRTTELTEAVRLLDLMGQSPREAVAVGAVVCLAGAADQCEWFAVFPGGDATVLRVGETAVRVLSASSPIMSQLRGLEAGECVVLRRGALQSEMEIVDVY